MEVSTAASALVHEANGSPPALEVGGRGTQISRDYAAKPPGLAEYYPVEARACQMLCSIAL